MTTRFLGNTNLECRQNGRDIGYGCLVKHLARDHVSWCVKVLIFGGSYLAKTGFPELTRGHVRPIVIVTGGLIKLNLIYIYRLDWCSALPGSMGSELPFNVWVSEHDCHLNSTVKKG